MVQEVNDQNTNPQNNRFLSFKDKARELEGLLGKPSPCYGHAKNLTRRTRPLPYKRGLPIGHWAAFSNFVWVRLAEAGSDESNLCE